MLGKNDDKDKVQAKRLEEYLENLIKHQERMLEASTETKGSCVFKTKSLCVCAG